MTTMSVGVEIKLIDSLTAPAKRLADSIERLKKSFEKTSQNLASNKMADAMRQFEAQTSRATQAASRLSESLSKANIAAKSFGSSVRDAGASMSAAVTSSNSIAAAQNRAARATLETARAAKAEAAAFHGTGVAAKIASMNIGAHMKNRWNAVRPHNVAHTAYDATADLSSEIFKFRALGRSQAEVAEARAAALKVAKSNPLFTEAEGLKTLRELTGVYGDLHEALAMLPQAAARTSYLKKLVPSETDPAHNLAKATELLGVPVTTPAGIERANKLQDMWTKSIAAAGGKLTSNDIFTFAKYQKGSARGLSDEVLGYIVPSIAQEMGGSTTGTSISSFMRAMVGGHMTKQAAESLNGYGLINPSKIIRDKTGKIKNLKPDAMIGADILKASPLNWIQDVLLPRLKVLGLTEQKQIGPILSQIFSNRNGENLSSILAFDLARLMKESTNAKNSKAPDEAAKLMYQTDLTTGLDSLKASINTFLSEVNIAAVGPAVTALQSLATGIAAITGAVAKFTGGAGGDHADGGSSPGGMSGRDFGALGVGGMGAAFAARYGLNWLRGNGAFAGAAVGGGAIGALIGGPAGGLYGAAAALTASAGALSAAAGKIGGGLPGMPGSGSGKNGLGLGRFFGLGMSGIGIAADIWNLPTDQEGLQKHFKEVGERDARINKWIGDMRPDWMRRYLKFTGDDQAAKPFSDATLGGTGRFSKSGTDTVGGFAAGIPTAMEWNERALGKLPTAGLEGTLQGSIAQAISGDVSAMTNGKGLQVIQGVADGIRSGAPNVTGAFEGVMGQLRSIAAGGVEIPIHVQTAGIAGKVGAAIANASAARPQVNQENHTVIKVSGSGDPNAVADAVERRWLERHRRRLHDGVNV